jgi:dUTPase
MKIAQFILVPISLVEPKEIGTDDELWDLWSKMSVIRSSSESTRGDGGFGSTGEF